MIHPTNKELILEDMTNAGDPQTDRELLLEVRNRVEMVTVTFEDKIEKLTDVIERAVMAIQNIEEKRIVRLEQRMDANDLWRQELKGSWKAIAAMMAAAATVGGLVVKYLFK